MEASRLKPFEKLLQTLEGKLMEGKLFKVCDRPCIHVHHVYKLFVPTCTYMCISPTNCMYIIIHVHVCPMWPIELCDSDI